MSENFVIELRLLHLSTPSTRYILRYPTNLANRNTYNHNATIIQEEHEITQINRSTLNIAVISPISVCKTRTIYLLNTRIHKYTSLPRHINNNIPSLTLMISQEHLFISNICLARYLLFVATRYLIVYSDA